MKRKPDTTKIPEANKILFTHLNLGMALLAAVEIIIQIFVKLLIL